MHLLQRPTSNDRGFTMPEVIVTATITATLSAIAIPLYLAQTDKAADAAQSAELRKAHTAAVTELLDDPTAATLDLSDPAHALAVRGDITVDTTITITDGTFCITAHQDGQSTASVNETGVLFDNATCAA